MNYVLGAYVMNKFKFLLIASAFAAQSAIAKPACDGFEITVKNKLADDLYATTLKVNGADLQPNGFEKLNSHSQQAFTINNSNANVPMHGEMTFHTLSVPSKTVSIQFSLDNKNVICKHNDLSPATDYAVEKTRRLGKVTYTISNK